MKSRKNKQAEAKKTVTKQRRDFMLNKYATIKTDDKVALRSLADQAANEFKNREPKRRVSNLDDVLRRKY